MSWVEGPFSVPKVTVLAKRFGLSPVAAKNSGENGDTHGARSLFVRSFVVSENVSKVAYELS